MTNKEKNEALSKFNNQLKSFITAARQLSTVKLMTEVQTNDGDNLNIDGDLVIGSSVYSLDENGNNTPTDDGEYTLTNGMVITVTDGKISNIAGDPESQGDTQSPDAEMDKQKLADTAPAPTDAPAPSGTDTTDLANDVAQLKEQMAQVIPALQSLLDATNTTNSNMAKEIEQLLNKVEQLSKEPAAAPIKNTSVSYSANKNTDSEMAKLNMFAKAFQESF